MGVLGGVFVLKSGLRILIRALEVPFLGPPKRQKWVILGVLAVPADLWNDRETQYQYSRLLISILLI